MNENVMGAEEDESFEYAMINDSTVYRMAQAGLTSEQMVGMLAKEKRIYIERLIALDNIAPKKIRTPDGQVYIWQCPLHLIPERQYLNQKP